MNNKTYLAKLKKYKGLIYELRLLTPRIEDKQKCTEKLRLIEIEKSKLTNILKRC